MQRPKDNHYDTPGGEGRGGEGRGGEGRGGEGGEGRGVTITDSPEEGPRYNTYKWDL